MTRFLILCFCLIFGSVACTDQTAQSGPVIVSGKADIGGAFDLIDQDGNIVTDQDIIGKPQLIYFGFSYCPDVCPTALMQMGLAQSKVDPSGENFRYIFISVDPERDTPENLKLYVTSNGFPKNLIGLTGSAEQIETTKTAYKMFSQKVDDPGSTAGYTIDHASLIFLMDQQGEFADVFTHSTTPDEMVKRLKQFQKNRN